MAMSAALRGAGMELSPKASARGIVFGMAISPHFLGRRVRSQGFHGRRCDVMAGRVVPLTAGRRRARAPTGAFTSATCYLWSKFLRFWNPGGSYFDASRASVKAVSISAKSRSAMS